MAFQCSYNKFLTEIYKVLYDLAPTYLTKFLLYTYFPCFPCCSHSSPQILFLTSGLCLSYLLCPECSSQAPSPDGFTHVIQISTQIAFPQREPSTTLCGSWLPTGCCHTLFISFTAHVTIDDYLVCLYIYCQPCQPEYKLHKNRNSVSLFHGFS